jgi:hypothetical protein
MDDAALFSKVLSESRSSGADRRRSVRHPLGTVGVVMAENEAEPSGSSLQVLVFNVSIHGAGFRSPTALELGAKKRIRIGNGPLFVSALFHVVSCRVRRDGTYDIGAEFV